MGNLSALDHADPAESRIEIRVLGPLRVRRGDGSLVGPREWRTSKTADLVRLLALRHGQPVAVQTLLEALWPDSDEQRGRASLRTAASQARRVLGADCLQRRLGGLELTDVWVDAGVFSTLARGANRLLASGDLAGAIKLTREADALYVGDVGADDNTSEWVRVERGALASVHHGMVVDAADAAVQLGWMRDAIEFAGRAIAVDRYSERACRALMQGYAGLGEVSRALHEYEKLRELLAEELGTDPSPTTRALHLKLLTTEADEPPALPQPEFVGREQEREWLRTVVTAALETRSPVVVDLIGPHGSGRRRLATEAGAGMSVAVLPLEGSGRAGARDWLSELVQHLGHDAGDGAVELAERPHEGEPLIVLVGSDQQADLAELERLAAAVLTLDGPVALVRALPPEAAASLREARGSRADDRVHRLPLPPLELEDVGRLAADVLAGEVTAQLVAEVAEQSGRLPGRVLELLTTWSRAGRVAATSRGLVVVPAFGGAAEHASHQLLAPLLAQLDDDGLDVLSVAALLGGPLTLTMILPLFADEWAADVEPSRAQVAAALDRLVDLSVLVPSPAGYEFRDALLRDAARSWLRPSARRQLHRRIAESALIATARRVDHWLEAGEPQLGRAASLEASQEAMADGRYEDARAHLLQVCSLGAMPDTEPRDRVELFEMLGEVCVVLGRADEARAAFAVAANVSRNHDLPDEERVRAKRDKTATFNRRRDDAERLPTSSPPQLVAVEEQQPAALDLDDSAVEDPDLERRLRAELEEADRSADPVPRAEARLRLVTLVCTPHRQFDLGRMWANEALATTVDERMRARAILASTLPAALLGGARLSEQPLADAAVLADRSGDRALQRRVSVLRTLVAHDLGAPSFADLHAEATAACEAASDAHWGWVRLRIAVERGELDVAQAVHAEERPETGGALVRQLWNLAEAGLSLRLGRPDEAVEILRSIADAEVARQSSLLLPEVVARLIVLEAPGNLDAAKEHFDLLDWATGGDHGFPRENCLRLLARAAVRAAGGQLQAAATAAANAADVAQSCGLPLASAQAHQARAQYLSEGGRWSEARLAEADAARIYTSLGMSAQAQHRGPSWRAATETRSGSPRVVSLAERGPSSDSA